MGQRGGSVLRLEEDNLDDRGQQRPLWCHALSAKRYCIYTLDAHSEAELVKWSEHGLGHLGPDHPDVAFSLNNLGVVLQAQGDYAKAGERFERVLGIMESTCDPSHPHVATALNNLAGVLQDQGDLIAAVRLHWRALTIQQQPPPNFAEGVVFFNLGRTAAAVGRPEAGLGLLATTYVIDRQIDHPDAEEQDLPAIQQAAEARGLDTAELDALLAEVEASYRQDRGRGLVAAAFPELDLGL
jgi:tetratricopeptide (TPR) repeat protein